MIEIKISYRGNSSTISFDKHEIHIGKDDSCDIQIKGWLISRKHSLIKKLPAGYVIEDMDRGANGTFVNDERVDIYGPLKVGDIIEISKYIMEVVSCDLVASSSETHFDSEIKSEPSFVDKDSVEIMQTSQSKVIEPTNSLTVHKNYQGERKRELKLMRKLHDKLIQTIERERKDISKLEGHELYKEAARFLDKIIEEDLTVERKNIDRIKKLVLDEAVGLGPLEDLLSDKSVSEIMVNSADEIFIEKNGKLQRSYSIFSSDQAVLDIIERIVSPLGRRIDESSPMVDARLKDGSRVNAIIPPLAIRGPSITIRKFPEKRLTVEDLVDMNSVSSDMAVFLKECVNFKKNIIISGGTGSGKTTLLNVLSNFIPNGERIITIEDAAELKLNHDHLISLESRPANAEGRGEVAIRDLVKNSLRMRPDRIVVGECRGAESLDMLQAMNTGHEGSLTTLHANTPRDALSRLETLVLMAGMDLPLQAIREQIVSAIDVIVQQTRFACGARKVTHITEVTGIEGSTIQLQDIFLYKKMGFNESGKVVGKFISTDTIPSFYQELKDDGVDVRTDYFSEQI